MITLQAKPRHRRTRRNLLIFFALSGHGNPPRSITGRKARSGKARNPTRKRRRSSRSSPKMATRSSRRRPRSSSPIRSVAGRGRAGAQGLSADAVLDQRARLLGQQGDRLAWPFSIGLLLLIVANVGFQYGINVWNRAIFDAIEKRDSATVFHLTALFFPLAIGSVLLGVAQVFARMGIQRRWRAWLTNSVITRWLDQRPLLPAQSRRRRSQESGISHRRGSADRNRLAGGFHRRRHLRVSVGRDLHRRALDHRRRADGHARRLDLDHSRLPRHRRDRLCRDRLRLDHDDRPPLRADLRGQEPGRGRIPLHADPRARERRKHRAARRRGGRARRHRQDFHQCAAAMGAARRPAHAHHAGVAGIEPDRAGRAAVAVRAEIPRRQHDARPGDAGGVAPSPSCRARSAGWSTIIRGSPTGTPARAASPR